MYSGWTPSSRLPCYSDRFGQWRDVFAGQGREAMPLEQSEDRLLSNHCCGITYGGQNACGCTSKGVNFGFLMAIGG